MEYKNYVYSKFVEKFPFRSLDEFNQFVYEYDNLPSFKISDNVESVGGCSEECHFIMRCVSQFYMEKVFQSMKIDMQDPNVHGDKGTPYRVIKMWTGDNLYEDTELMSGRWTKAPRIATFPKEYEMQPITKRVDVVSVCSHHLAPFSTFFRDDSYAIVSYIPKDKVLGISKLQRVVDHIARRGHLQENLTKAIYDEVSKVAETESVYVKLCNLSHTCESLRGTQTKEGTFTSEHFGGEFNDPEIRKQVK